MSKWINPYYLEPHTIHLIKESVRSKPHIHYAVLDNFYNRNVLDEFVAYHRGLSFDEQIDRYDNDAKLPYDGAVKFADNSDCGSELFFDLAWQQYCSELVGCNLVRSGHTVVKLRWHRPDANGFWIHTDRHSVDRRSMVVISYFNMFWNVVDGGLLQLWMVDDASAFGVPIVDSVDSDDRLDVLKYSRIRTSTPGGGFDDGLAHDLILLDQIMPIYNRVFLCDFQTNPAYHSITPSNGRARTAVVQWMY